MTGNGTKDQTALPQPQAVEKPQLQADRTWYNSLFTQLLGPLVATRYVWLAIEDINPFDFLRKKESLVKQGKLSEHTTGPAFKEPSFGRYFSRNFAAYGMGATFLSITSLYSKNTLHDLKEVYAEAVGYELNKPAKDVGYADIFFKSNNEALAVTRSAYVKRTLARLATAATFFIPWHKFRDFKELPPKYDANANVGVGAVGVYLYSEGFMRRPSFFDVEQRMISSKINHKDTQSYAIIQQQDIQSLLMLHERHLDKNHIPAYGASEDGQNDVQMARRIADLMNQTYNNTERREPAYFTIGKFNYLLGFGLLDNFPESMAYIELANRSADMQDVKRAQAAIKSGQDPHSVFAAHGIDMEKLAQRKQDASCCVLPEHTPAHHAANITPKQMPQPKTLQDYAQQPAAESQARL